MNDCQSCTTVCETAQCPICGNSTLRPPASTDFVFLVEKQQPWSGTVQDVLTQHGIPYTTQSDLGPALAMKAAPAAEQLRFFVPYHAYQQAAALMDELFGASPQG